MKPKQLVSWVVVSPVLLAVAGCSGPEDSAGITLESLRRFESSWEQHEREFAFAHYDEVWPPSSVIEASVPVRELPRGPSLPGFDMDGSMAAELDRFVTEQKVSGLLVLHQGSIRLERYALGHSPEGSWTSHSMGKSMTSTLVGVALQDGSIGSLDDLVTTYLDELDGSGYEGVTVRQLLTMTSGATWSEDYTDRDSHWARSNRSGPRPA